MMSGLAKRAQKRSAGYKEADLADLGMKSKLQREGETLNDNPGAMSDSLLDRRMEVDLNRRFL